MSCKAYYQSPIGTLVITGNAGCITALTIQKDSQTNNSHLPEYMEKAVQQLHDYFTGTLQQFHLPVSYESAPAFTQGVWDALAAIPYGETRSYGEVAHSLGNGNAARAVGNACNRNYIPLIIPCHRVVGSNGAMTGFALGIEVKEWLLAHEKRHANCLAA